MRTHKVLLSLLPSSQQTWPLLPLLKCFQFGTGKEESGSCLLVLKPLATLRGRKLACGFPGFVCLPVSRREKISLCPVLLCTASVWWMLSAQHHQRRSPQMSCSTKNCTMCRAAGCPFLPHPPTSQEAQIYFMLSAQGRNSSTRRDNVTAAIFSIFQYLSFGFVLEITSNAFYFEQVCSSSAGKLIIAELLLSEVF